mgnify:CR=1 FL=1
MLKKESKSIPLSVCLSLVLKYFQFSFVLDTCFISNCRLFLLTFFYIQFLTYAIGFYYNQFYIVYTRCASIYRCIAWEHSLSNHSLSLMGLSINCVDLLQNTWRLNNGSAISRTIFVNLHNIVFIDSLSEISMQFDKRLKHGNFAIKPDRKSCFNLSDHLYLT